ncbi:hypothetical protein EV132_111114 [Rhizobium sullae]|uniref:Uncharacterized protein n=1 Tax=Rhizobium sullae TaxID=50338 RepID=A0A4R3PYS1_RHISU|nr:hypothetical protein EV132_111114 [Rhizobium sullae]
MLIKAIVATADEDARPAPNDAIMVTSQEPYGSSITSNEGELLQASLL